jgi:hypothetical protein
MSYRNPISSSDPDAIGKLTEKLTSCRELQALMKETNAYWRKHGTCKGAPGITDEQAVKLESRLVARLEAGYSRDRSPFRGYELQNNNAEIKRLERRIAEISRDRETGFTGWEFEGGRAIADTDINRLQLVFDEKPDEHKRSELKRNGFKWAPSQGAWQRQLTANAIHAAGWIDFVRPIDGRTVREIQPKQPAQDKGAR